MNLISQLRFSLGLVPACLCILFIWNPIISFTQVTERAFNIADSICQSRMLCPSILISLKDSTFDPVDRYLDGNSHMYSFVYEVELRKDIITYLKIAINPDYSQIKVKGIPSDRSKLTSSMCEIKERKQLWLIAKMHGLKTNYKRSRYTILFYNDDIIIRFHEKNPEKDVDYYDINALAGDFIKHVDMYYKY